MSLLLVSGLAALIGGTSLWYALALRNWLRCLRAPEFASMNEHQRVQFMRTPEYAKLRNAVRRPMYATTILCALLYVVFRLTA